MSVIKLRYGLAAGVLALTQVSAQAATPNYGIVLNNTAQWLSDLGLSSLSQIGADQTIDFSYNAAGTRTGWNPSTSSFNTGLVAQFDEGLFGFNQTASTYSQLYTGANVGHITSSVSFVNNPWSLQIVRNGTDQSLAFNGPASGGDSSAIGMQFWSKSSACTYCFNDGVKAVSFDLTNYSLKPKADSTAPYQEGLLMVTYLNSTTHATRSDFAEVFNTTTNETLTYNIGAVANIGEVIYQLSYFDCFKTADHVHWLGCSAQSAVDNIRIVQAVPEPETYALMVAGLGLVGFRTWRRRQTAA